MEQVDLNKVKVSKAVASLFHIVQKKEEKELLIENVDKIQMQICLKKIPPRSKTIKLKLPHSIYQPDLDVCLFVKDLDMKNREYERTVLHFQDFLKNKGVNCITDIIPLKSLKTEYKPFEAKKNLCNAYDLFLADSRIVKFLPKCLGKHFYDRKKFPIQVNLQAKDLVKEINSAVGNSTCVISSKGASSITAVGHLKMSLGDVTENVIAAAEQISHEVGGRASNIKQLNLKTETSMSIPIYMSEGGPQGITLPKEEKVGEKVEAEELSTLLNVKVKVYPTGHIKVIPEENNEIPNETKKEVVRKRSNKKNSNLKPKGKRIKLV
ncbi:Ribosomal L1 domain-containing protein 1 [Bulinus truncatus]|nr:Ribosomal L1 domain-containing protein 1 [Bulinus truncatus]